MKRNLTFLIFELLNYSFTVIMSRQKLTLIDELNQTLKFARQDKSGIVRNSVNTEYGILLMIKSRRLRSLALTNQTICLF
jgi:hypothetical protein